MLLKSSYKETAESASKVEGYTTDTRGNGDLVSSSPLQSITFMVEEKG